jgi:hypothetical protein
VQNPFRSEAEAFRFVMLLIAYFAAIVIAKALFGNVAGVIVFVAVTVGALWWISRGPAEGPIRRTTVRRGTEDERRILVIANETVGGETLREMIRERSEGYSARVLVVVPALNSPLKHWVSDEDGARAAAAERLQHSLDQLGALGIDAKGEVGDSEPLQAIEDWLHIFGADEIIISTHPEGRSNWLERGVVSGARARFDLPITHVVVDLEAEHEEVHERA